jgi:hypothetical protein
VVNISTINLLKVYVFNMSMILRAKDLNQSLTFFLLAMLKLFALSRLLTCIDMKTS